MAEDAKELQVIDSLYTDLRLRQTDEWTEVLGKERETHFVSRVDVVLSTDRY